MQYPARIGIGREKGRWAVGGSRASDAADDLVELREGVLALADGVLALGLGDPELLLQLLDVALLVRLAVVEAGQDGDQVLDLLLLGDQVLGELDLRGLEDVRRVGVDWRDGGGGEESVR